jgi:hypothetical protein
MIEIDTARLKALAKIERSRIIYLTTYKILCRSYDQGNLRIRCVVKGKSQFVN